MDWKRTLSLIKTREKWSKLSIKLNKIRPSNNSSKNKDSRLSVKPKLKKLREKRKSRKGSRKCKYSRTKN